MGRVSHAQAKENRQRVVATAARLFREKGTGTSIADVMQAAGMTHGAFYKRFPSKDALVGEAVGWAFAELEGRLTPADDEQGGRRDAARQALIDWYLSAGHRDDAANGCPSAGLAADMARDAGGASAQQAYADGVRDFAGRLTLDGGGQGLADLATMVGAVLLARATRGLPLSDEILRAAHDSLSAST
ncbi:TetR family transcriptional regulator [Streptomyces sp. ME03-5709C]|nr:TetR family transcriptional regulator [Streptomyces sp. ME03-5709C]